MGIGGGSVAVLGAVAVALGRMQNIPAFNNLGAGILAALPLFFAVMTVLGIRQMDEYGRQLHARAASIAFLVVMLLAGTLISLEAILDFHTPPWVLYVAGMGVWGTVGCVLAARDGRMK
ncbi:hypothetical protein [Deinococcus sp. QL22]|uniref:hypothetical protein n=1 Tax=Deinococcus sp. QL22 TaxID=2939437 RepID=UPI002017E101|nr:hypothetical protein [Deinococcus sp. QL22]UQN05750.1 hypothetical protein M1R55_12860 [Deinococcus sp. QL22]